MKWFLAICALVFVAALAAPQKASQQPQIPNKPIVDEWFGVFENALSDLSKTSGHWEEKIENGKKVRVWIEPEFGMSRLPRIQGHGVATQTDYIDRDKQEHARAMQEAAGLSMTIIGFGNGTDKLTKETIHPRFNSLSPVTQSILKTEDAQKFVVDSFDKIMKGTIAFQKIGDWNVQTRLMRLNKKECLSCHINNKLNDPVAIFAFATKPK
jgi:hypothetical protein